MATRIAHKSEIPEGHRLCKEVDGRTVTVFQHSGKFHCIDANCYHMGGPVGAEGDIEDLGGRVTIRCPWHGHKINVDTGGVVETDLNGNLSCSQTQHRVHNVYHDTDGWIWVKLMEPLPKLRVDEFNRDTSPVRMHQTSSNSRGFGLSTGFQQALPGANEGWIYSDTMPGLKPYCGEDKLLPVISSPSKAAQNGYGDAAMNDSELPETLSQEEARVGSHPAPQRVSLGQPDWSTSGSVHQHFRVAKSGGAMAGSVRNSRNEAARRAISKRQIKAPLAKAAVPVLVNGAPRQASIKDFFQTRQGGLAAEDTATDMET